MLAIAAFGLAVALGLLVIGPEVMKIFFSSKAGQYNRFGLALVGLGMGLHLISGTLNQAALARGRAAMAAACWLTAAALFVGFQLVDIISSQVWRVEVGYFGATAVLCVLLVAAVPPRERGGRRRDRPCPPRSRARRPGRAAMSRSRASARAGGVDHPPVRGGRVV